MKLVLDWLRKIRLRRDLRRRAEKALWLSGAIVESSQDAIFGQTLEGIITSWNRSAERIFGYTAEEAVGKHARFLVPSERWNEIKIILEKVDRREKIEQFETRRVRKDGETIDVSLTVSPIFERGRRITGISVIARDITQRKMLEKRQGEQAALLEKSHEQLARRERIMSSLLEDLQATTKKLEEQKISLQEANKRLESLNRLKDEFVATASHELRTPLTAIREGISLLHDRVLGPINEEQAEFLSAVDENIERLTGLINNILDLSKIEAGHFMLSRRRVNIGHLIRTLIENNKKLAGERALQADIPAEAAEAFADPNRVFQLLWNLLSNALKFSANNGIIRFSLRQGTGFVTVSVQDDGIGITPEDIPRLFQKFSQARGGFSRGTGLGLALCKQIIELHKGRIWVESEVGKGSTFFFSLPVYTPELALQEYFEEQRESARRNGKKLGLLVMDASFAEQAPAAGKLQALDAVADRARKILYSGDAALAMEPRWIVILAQADTDGLAAIVRRLSRIFGKNSSSKESPSVPHFGLASYPADGVTGRALFEKAAESAGILETPRG